MNRVVNHTTAGRSRRSYFITYEADTIFPSYVHALIYRPYRPFCTQARAYAPPRLLLTIPIKITPISRLKGYDARPKNKSPIPVFSQASLRLLQRPSTNGRISVLSHRNTVLNQRSDLRYSFVHDTRRRIVVAARLYLHKKVKIGIGKAEK